MNLGCIFLIIIVFWLGYNIWQEVKKEKKSMKLLIK